MIFQNLEDFSLLIARSNSFVTLKPEPVFFIDMFAPLFVDTQWSLKVVSCVLLFL